MLDFLVVSKRPGKRNQMEIYPTFVIKKSKDLMIRGGDFYAIWVEDEGIWSTDEQEAIRLIDKEIDEYASIHAEEFGSYPKILHMWDAGSGVIDAWHKYCQKQMRDNFHMLDEKLIFANDGINKKDYASKRLPYPLEEGPITAYNKLMSTLYSEEERHKIEWAIGSIVTGDSKKIQKFMVLYGAAGTGKSTVLNIIQALFDGYYCVFDAKALGSSSNSFALEAFKTNPLVAIQHDGDLSRIEDNTRLNSLVSHELMTVNEKFKSTYANRFKSFLFMGTNKPVKITDGKSGLIRRLIDVAPTGDKIPTREYKSLIKQIDFELGAIAWHCKEVYLEDPSYYDGYIPTIMMGASNDFYNYILDSFHVFKKANGTTLKAAWEMYKTYCDEAKVPYPLAKMAFKEELKNYFKEYKERHTTEKGTVVRSYYYDFRTDIFEDDYDEPKLSENHTIEFKVQESIFDIECSGCYAQYATKAEIPKLKWDNVQTQLYQIDTSRTHFVKVPENHIVIDFDIKDANGKKSFEKNLEEASKWPATYAELSKSEAGIHLHYIYNGDVTKLSRVYDDSIEIKVFTGNSSLRRKLTKCNNTPIATISSGLPLKGESKMVNFEAIKNEKTLRTLIKRNLNKEIHPGTKPSVDFIYKLLEDAYNGGISYDISDLKNDILIFGANSTHQADYCLKLIAKMHFKSEEISPNKDCINENIVFFDCEVFPNLFLVNYKPAGEGKPIIRLINPKPSDIEELAKFRLIGFNCRRYDNHMLYACMLGYDNEQLYNLSQKIVNSKKGSKGVFFGEAYNLSYTDIYDFAATKQSLKKWEIELGIHHQELGLPWDEPVPEKMWQVVAEYCDNDVIATEAVWNHLQPDFLARQILADIAGMTVNDTTNSLTTRIIFGKEKHPALIYTDLSETFPGYEFTTWYEYYQKYPGYLPEGKSLEDFSTDTEVRNLYRGTDLGKGGYVYAEPGMYSNIALLDVASLHPHSIKAMNCFGEYTKNFTDIMDARIFVKHKEYDKAKELFGGKLAKYLDDPTTAKQLSQALKIAINSVYGLTSANFDTPFRDIRNKNNIVALRGALFMRELQEEVAARGFTVAHIKTDSIKIPNATKDIIDFCMGFAKKYGYEFEHEATYSKMCLVNNAVYIAKYSGDESINGDSKNQWTATGTQFQIPYVFKTLFTKEPIIFEDMCETKQVTTCMYLDINETLPEGEHDYKFVGKIGQFCPIKPGCNGGVLLRSAVDKDGNPKYDSVTGAKDYRWLESERVKAYGSPDDIDRGYYNRLVDEAVESISEYGDFEWFASDDDIPPEPYVTTDDLPWKASCGKKSCYGCSKFSGGDICSAGYDTSDYASAFRNDLFDKR